MIMNSMEPSILLIGGKSCSVSEGLLKCLRQAKFKNVTLLEYSSDAAHLYRVENFIISSLTPDNSLDFIDYIITICTSRGINIVIPGSTWEAKIISRHREKLLNLNIIPLVNNFQCIELGDDKWITYQKLSELNISTPQTYIEIDDRFAYPIVIKPRQGRGSQNVFVAKSRTELELLIQYFSLKKIEYVIQEYMKRDDQEYTVGIISESTGKVVQSIVMRRKLLGGATGYAEVCNHSYINDFCEEVAEKIKSTGPINIQLRLDDDGKPFVFEINPRFSGSAPMRMLAGFNEIEMMIKHHFNKEKIEKKSIKAGSRFYRVFQEIEIEHEKKQGVIINLL
jgi:carbamoyl-phosphate synthase large subunit